MPAGLTRLPRTNGLGHPTRRTPARSSAPARGSAGAASGRGRAPSPRSAGGKGGCHPRPGAGGARLSDRRTPRRGRPVSTQTASDHPARGCGAAGAPSGPAPAWGGGAPAPWRGESPIRRGPPDTRAHTRALTRTRAHSQPRRDPGEGQVPSVRGAPDPEVPRLRGDSPPQPPTQHLERRSDPPGQRAPGSGRWLQAALGRAPGRGTRWPGAAPRARGWRCPPAGSLGKGCSAGAPRAPAAWPRRRGAR